MTPTSSSGHTSRAKDPVIVRESQSIIKIISNVFFVMAFVVLILGIFSWIKGCKEEEKTPSPPAVETPGKKPEDPYEKTLTGVFSPDGPKASGEGWPVFRDSVARDSGIVLPGKPWESKITWDFFRLRASDSVFVQYTAKGGGWTEWRLALPGVKNRHTDVGKGPIRVTLPDSTSGTDSVKVTLWEMKK